MKITKSYKTIEHFTPKPDGTRSFSATNTYATVHIQETSDNYIIQAVFTDLLNNNVAAVHIHSNVGGAPGPILAWLLTSPQWQDGTLQQTPGKNSPCCNTAAGSRCSLVAPPGTMMVSSAVPNRVYTFRASKKYCGSSCPGITMGSPFAFLVIHGGNFQTVSNGCLSVGQPQLDVLVATPLSMQSS